MEERVELEQQTLDKTRNQSARRDEEVERSRIMLIHPLKLRHFLSPYQNIQEKRDLNNSINPAVMKAFSRVRSNTCRKPAISEGVCGVVKVTPFLSLFRSQKLLQTLINKILIATHAVKCL